MMTTTAHAHAYKLPAADGPFSAATCACGVTQLRSNSWVGDYSPDEWATHMQRARAKSSTFTKTKHPHHRPMPRLVFGKMEKGIA